MILFSKAMKCSVMNLLEWLYSKRLISDLGSIGDFIISDYIHNEVPIYLKFILGVGAFISSLCFIGFIHLSKLIDYSDELVVVTWGVIFVLVAIMIYKLFIDKKSIQSTFFVQLSFSFMVVGKLLFVYGCHRILKSGWDRTLSIIFINVLTYGIYKISLDRFISVLSLMISMFYDILFEKYTFDHTEVFFIIFCISQLIALSFFITSVKFRSNYYPVSYALVLSLCIEVLFLSFEFNIGNFHNKYQVITYAINLILTLWIFVLLRSIFGKFDQLKLEQFIIAFIAIGLLGFISSPGILLAIALIVIGYDKYETVIIVFGALLMALSLFSYYFNLRLSLISKSLVIIGSGIVLLLGNSYISYRGWNKEKTQ